MQHFSILNITLHTCMHHIYLLLNDFLQSVTGQKGILLYLVTENPFLIFLGPDSCNEVA